MRKTSSPSPPSPSNSPNRFQCVDHTQVSGFTLREGLRKLSHDTFTDSPGDRGSRKRLPLVHGRVGTVTGPPGLMVHGVTPPDVSRPMVFRTWSLRPVGEGCGVRSCHTAPFTDRNRPTTRTQTQTENSVTRGIDI